MALQPDRTEVDFLGLAEKIDTRKRPVGALETSRNVVYTKTGRIDKRRGYQRLPQNNAVDGSVIDPDEQIFQRVCSCRGELVVIGHDVLIGLVSRSSDIAGGRLAIRGPVPRCNVTTTPVSAAGLTATRAP